jgi:type II secretory pathway component PulF
VAVLIVWWLRSRSAWRLEGGLSRGYKSERRWRFPTVGKLLHAGRMATLADTLALLIEHDVPCHEALLLAANASGDRRFREAVVPLAVQLERGELVTWRNSAGTPQLLIWLLGARLEQSRMVACLRRSADSYRRQAEWLSRWLAIYLPFWLTVSIGGTATAVYVLSVIGPWCRMLCELGAP